MIPTIENYLKEYKKAIKYIDTTIDNKFVFIALKPYLHTKDIFSIIEKMKNERYDYQEIEFDPFLNDITIWFNIPKKSF